MGNPILQQRLYKAWSTFVCTCLVLTPCRQICFHDIISSDGSKSLTKGLDLILACWKCSTPKYHVVSVAASSASYHLSLVLAAVESANCSVPWALLIRIVGDFMLLRSFFNSCRHMKYVFRKKKKGR